MLGKARPDDAPTAGAVHSMTAGTRVVLDPPDPLIRALAAFVEALDQRYPGGPDELPDAGLAIDAVQANMRTVFDDEGSPAA